MSNDTDAIQINHIDVENILVNPVEETVTIIDNLVEIPVGVVDGIPIEEKGVPNGVATLDESGKVPLTQIPDIDVNQIKLEVERWISDAASVKADQNDLVALELSKADKATVDLQLNEKLDRSDYQQHFRGLFNTVESLKSQVMNPDTGNYALVDAGIDSPAVIYAYDIDDNDWIKQGSTGLSVLSTDSIPEGNNNLYHTSDRVKAVVKSMSTTDLPEGINQYYTDDKVAAVVNGLLTPIQNQIGEIDILLNELLGN